MPPHDHDPGHEHTHEDEEFPRVATSELIGHAEIDRERRERWQVWVLAFGLFALALGLPTERVFVTAPVLEAVGPRPFLYWTGVPIARAMSAMTGLSAERSWFLLSALCLGLSLPLLAGTLRKIGFSSTIATLCAATALLSPFAWIGATVPGARSAGLLTSVILFRALFTAKGGRTDGWRPALAWLLAAATHPGNALLFPVLFRDTRLRSRPVPPIVCLVAYLGLAGLPALTAVFSGLFDPVIATILDVPRVLLGFPIWLLVGLGAGSWGLLVLFHAKRLPEESPPPLWLRPWCAMALVLPFFDRELFLHAAVWLVPASAVGLADGLSRLEREEGGFRAGSVALAGQIVFTLLVTVGLRMSDDGRDWRRAARAHLEPSDLVITASAEHAYLLAQRWGMNTVDLSAVSELDTDPPDLTNVPGAARSDGGRIVVDRGRGPDDYEERFWSWLSKKGVWELNPEGVSPLQR